MDSDISFSKESFKFLDGKVGHVGGCPIKVMRIGFTGELSYELHTPQSYGEALWEALLTVGEPHNLKPYGLEASRILRLEKGHIIIGRDTDALSTPDELSLEWALSKKKPFYIGKTALGVRRRAGLTRKLCGFELPENTIVKPAESCLILKETNPVGFVTSTCFSPSLGKWIGLAYVHPDDANPGLSITIKGRCGNTVSACVISPHFFDPENKRQEM